MTPAYFGILSNVATAAQAYVAPHATTTATPPPAPTFPPVTSTGTSTSSIGTSGWGNGSQTSTSNSAALKTAIQTLRGDIENIEQASGTTVSDLTNIRLAFKALSSDGLVPSSRSALQSFENSLVTANAATPSSLTGTTAQVSQFATTVYNLQTPSATQTTDLTTAYKALAKAVTDAGITSADITAINTDWSAVLKSLNNTSTNPPKFDYFTLVTGQVYGHGLGFGFGGAW